MIQMKQTSKGCVPPNERPGRSRHTASCYLQPDIINTDVPASTLSLKCASAQNGSVCSVLLSQLDPIATNTLKQKENRKGRGGGVATKQ